MDFLSNRKLASRNTKIMFLQKKNFVIVTHGGLPSFVQSFQELVSQALRILHLLFPGDIIRHSEAWYFPKGGEKNIR